MCSEALLTGVLCNHIKLCIYQTNMNTLLGSYSWDVIAAFEVRCLLLDLGLIRFYVSWKKKWGPTFQWE